MGAHPSLEVRADTALTDEAHDLGVTFTLTATDGGCPACCWTPVSGGSG